MDKNDAVFFHSTFIIFYVTLNLSPRTSRIVCPKIVIFSQFEVHLILYFLVFTSTIYILYLLVFFIIKYIIYYVL